MTHKLLAALLLEAVLAAESSPLPDANLPEPMSERYNSLILRQAERRHLSPRLVKAVIAAESEFKAEAVSPVGARGLMQLMPETAAELGVSSDRLADPEANVGAGTAYLELLFKAARLRYGLRAARLSDAPAWAQRRVLAAYNGGPRLLARDRWPLQTRLYVRKVRRFYLRPDQLQLRNSVARQP